MKKLIVLAFALFTLPAFAGVGDKIFGRFSDPDAPRTVFIPKGNWSMGVSGGYRSFEAGGNEAGDGFSILSLLNIGNGYLRTYNVSPSFSYFLADDLSLGISLDYSGYSLDTDIRLDFRNMFDINNIVSELDDPQTQEEIKEMSSVLNVRLSGRHMVRNAWGESLKLRKYLSFFGSNTFAIFGEARLYGSFAYIESCPIDAAGAYQLNKGRTSYVWDAGLKLAGGLCVRLRDNSAITLSIPLIGANYQYTSQHKTNTLNDAHMSSFSISRDLDYLALQVGYVHYIAPKKR